MKKIAASVYWRKGTFIVCPCSYTTEGVSIESGPVFIAEPDAPMAVLGELTVKALDNSKTEIPHPTDWSAVSQVVPKALGLKSHRALTESKTRYCDAEQRDDIITLTPSKRSDDDEGFDFLPDAKLTLSANSSWESLGEAIMEALRRSE